MDRVIQKAVWPFGERNRHKGLDHAI
jgi:hypothetical protein